MSKKVKKKDAQVKQNKRKQDGKEIIDLDEQDWRVKPTRQDEREQGGKEILNQNEQESRQIGQSGKSWKERVGSYWPMLLVVICVVLSLLLTVASWRAWQAEIRVAELSYEPVRTPEDGFYPARASGDYTDICFEMNSYLDSIGATGVTRAIYSTSEGTKQKLKFSLGDFDWTVETTIFKADSSFGLYTSIEARDRIDGRIYRVPSRNSGELIMDATSPFWFDRLAFDVVHIATDEDSELRDELRTGMHEEICPFYGLGISHFDKNPKTGVVFWHDDLGAHRVDDGLDLHY